MQFGHIGVVLAISTYDWKLKTIAVAGPEYIQIVSAIILIGLLVGHPI